MVDCFLAIAKLGLHYADCLETSKCNDAVLSLRQVLEGGARF
jgi:hypothetical protein